MERKFSYKSDWFYFAAFGIVLSSLFQPFLIVGIAVEVEHPHAAVYVLFGLYLLIVGGSLYFLPHMRASYRADDTSVTFRLFLRTVTVPYSTIRKLEISREYTKVIIRGDVPHYVEHLDIVTDTEELHFQSDMQIDLEDAAAHPEHLQEQFEAGVFRSLQRFIEERSGRTFAADTQTDTDTLTDADMENP